MARLLFTPVPNAAGMLYVTDTRDGDAHLGLVQPTSNGHWVARDDCGLSAPFATRDAAGQHLVDRADAHFAKLGIALPA